MSHHHEAKHGHRAERVARTVAELLEYELLPALDNPALEELHVLRVEASHNLASLQVIVVPKRPEPSHAPDAVQVALSSAESLLRAELAGLLRIKRMPVLKLRYLPLPLYGTEGGDA